MNHFRIVLAVGFTVISGVFFGFDLSGAEAAPPAGFKALFNGKDTTGWYGLGHFDPRRREAIADEKREQNQETFKAHWTVVSQVIFAPDGSLLLSCGDPALRQWSAPKLEEIDMEANYDQVSPAFGLNKSGLVPDNADPLR